MKLGHGLYGLIGHQGKINGIPPRILFNINTVRPEGMGGRKINSCEYPHDRLLGSIAK